MISRRTLPRAAAALAAGAALLLSACSSSSNGKDFSFTSFTTKGTIMPSADRKPAQDIGGDLLGGGKMSLSDAAGKVVVVNFWASWCGPCAVETPQFDLLYRKVKSKGVAFVGIDTKDEKSGATTFIDHNHISYPMIYDFPGKTALTLGNIPANLPFTVLVDKTGKVAAVYNGQVTDKDLQKSIDSLSAET